MKIAIVGPSRCGKDEVAAWLAANTTLRYTGFSTSRVIAPVVATRLGMTVEAAFACRHLRRELWRQIGDELRATDPAYLAREALKHQDLCVGIRARIEIEAVQVEELVDTTIWIDRDVPEDPTLEFGPSVADLILPNRDGLDELHWRLEGLARAWGILLAATRVIRS